ncbi:MAG: choice-of-anchor I family protein [Pseudomonadota bacterium]
MKNSIQAVFIFLLNFLLLACSHNPTVQKKDFVPKKIKLEQISRITNGGFESNSAEFIAYDNAKKRLYVVNNTVVGVDIFDISQPESPRKIHTIGMLNFGSRVTSIAVKDPYIAITSQSLNPLEKGKIVIFDSKEWRQRTVFDVGVDPKMAVFHPSEDWILVSNEGPPNDDYSKDPEGTLSLVDYSNGIINSVLTTLRFKNFETMKSALLAQGLHLSSEDVKLEKDLEPDYIALHPTQPIAWVTLQESNAIAVVDLYRQDIVDIYPLGYKDYQISNNTLDASDKDGGINFKGWPVLGLLQPSGVASVKILDQVYWLTANEGKARDYKNYQESVRVNQIELEAGFDEFSKTIKNDDELGRLHVSAIRGDKNDDSIYEKLYSFGGRSFSIFNELGIRIWDSGNDFETKTAEFLGNAFNNDSRQNTPDGRSDDQGPAPKSIVVAELENQFFAFITLEQVGGIMSYNITNPFAPTFIDYINTRDFSLVPQQVGAAAGDLGPKHMIFLSGKEAPNQQPILVVANNVSGTITLYKIKVI